jgi:predicted secreted Zn-dependent protease
LLHLAGLLLVVSALAVAACSGGEKSSSPATLPTDRTSETGRATADAPETTTAASTSDDEEPNRTGAALPIARGCDPHVGSNRREITIRCRSYIVTGSTLAELRHELDRGVLDPYDNTRVAALTSWYVRWRYRYTTSSQGCSISDPTVSVRFMFVVPRWKAKADAERDLVEEWNRFYVALWRHERGHVRNALLAADEIEETLEKLAISQTCEQLEAEADGAGARILKKHRARDRTYDAATAHGETQGAVIR